jgi:hypothetical protein
VVGLEQMLGLDDRGEPLEWGLLWRTPAETSRIRAFDATARDVTKAGLETATR